ncbi:MAG: hypothetical protein NXI10_00935 [bacterium]|nr:hypothetical protein [bacterium]
MSLYDGELTSFPSEVLSLIHLKQLNLSGHNFTSVPSGISNLSKLRSLEFDRGASVTTPINSLPESIGQLKNLEYLSLGYTKEGIGDLPDGFYQLEKLNSFSCNSCGFSGFDDRIANLPLEGIHLMNTKQNGPLPDVFFELPNLTSLYFCAYCQGTCDAIDAQESKIREWAKA